MEDLIRLLPVNYEAPKAESTVKPFGGWCQTPGAIPLGDPCSPGYSPPKGWCDPTGQTQISRCDPGCVPM